MLRKQAVKKGVRLVERVMITDLLTSDGLHPSGGRVVGAVGIDTRESTFHVFQAGAVVLATGPISGKRSNVDDVCTSDGLVSGFRAGAEVANMEFCTSGNINVWQRKTAVGGINMIQGHGGTIVNSRGERFMEKYDSILMERSLLYKLCLAFAKESLEGRGPIMVDIRQLPPETLEKFRRVIPRTMKIWDSLGVDVSKEKLECTPSWSLRSASGEGGLKIDLSAATSLPGLYAAGAATRNPVQGIYALGGIATASCNVLGFVAGESAARYALSAGPGRLDAGQISALRETALAPLRRKEGPEPAELFEKLDRAAVPAPFSMFKSATRIVRTLAAIENIKEELPRLRAVDGHELVRANEFRNYAGCAELVFRAALERKESRQYHYREDYPYRDDVNWLKLVVMQRQGHSLAVKYEPIPLEKWQYRPKTREKISHPVQMFIGGE